MSGPHHIDEQGHARMVDVGDKEQTDRRAVARGVVNFSRDAFDALVNDQAPKGDVLAAARVAGIMAAKRTSELIPLCHQIALASVKVELLPMPANYTVVITATVRAKDQTGVEMEALTAVSVAALTLYDMMKSLDRNITIENIELIEKTGGKTGTYLRNVRVVEKTEPNEPIEEVERPNERALLTPQEEKQQENESCLLPPPSPTAESIARAQLVQTLDPKARELETFLADDPLNSAYMLGDLDSPYVEHCQWYGLHDEGLRSVLLVYSGLSVPAVLTKGPAEDVEALVEATRPELPRRFICQIRTEHRRAFECYYELQDEKSMLRMGCTRDDFVETADSEGVIALNHRDTAAIMKLYTHYPDNFFEPAMLGTGLYFGVREAGELVSVAGLHVLSEQYDVAAIGNIVTHSDWRGRGLATRCVRRLLDELFKRVANVTLNVERDNLPAIACYAKFGFTERYPFVEGIASAR